MVGHLVFIPLRVSFSSAQVKLSSPYPCRAPDAPSQPQRWGVRLQQPLTAKDPPFLLLPSGRLCPARPHYSLCTPGRPDTCAGLEGPPGWEGDRRCYGGCVCNAGLVLSGVTCVLTAQCSCSSAGWLLPPTWCAAAAPLPGNRPLPRLPPWRPGGLQTLPRSPGAAQASASPQASSITPPLRASPSTFWSPAPIRW